MLNLIFREYCQVSHIAGHEDNTTYTLGKKIIAFYALRHIGIVLN